MNCQICGSHFAEDQIREGPNSGKIVCGQCASMLRREHQQQLDYQRAVLRSSHNKEFHNNVRACLIYLNADPHAGDRDRVLACLREGSFGLARMAVIRVQSEIDSYHHENQMGN